jgi:NAD(P)-dependent dehydrogenase (short-subunit alcohol dehydrogenase family)
MADGPVALVTGSTSGIGADVARRLIAQGTRVVLNSVTSVDAGRAMVEQLGDAAHYVQGDISVEADVARLVAETIEHFGRLDILVNNAGVHTGAKSWEMTEAQWDVVIDVDLKGPFLCSKHAARHMIGRDGGGRIITISSTSALVGIPDQVSYQSAKHGLVGQVKTLALELAPYGVTVNTVAPTVVESPLLDHLMTTGQAYFQDVARLCGSSTVFPGIDFLEQRDVTHAVQWLASDAARYVTGIALPVDGGFTCK